MPLYCFEFGRQRFVVHLPDNNDAIGFAQGVRRSLGFHRETTIVWRAEPGGKDVEVWRAGPEDEAAAQADAPGPGARTR